MTTTVYCFVDGAWGDDVTAVAVCGDCGAVLGGHMSSNVSWAQHDMMRSYHVKAYGEHMTEQHGGSEIHTLWLDKPMENPELRALIERAKQEADGK